MAFKDLSPEMQREVQRILDAEARWRLEQRLAAEQVRAGSEKGDA